MCSFDFVVMYEQKQYMLSKFDDMENMVMYAICSSIEYYLVHTY